MREIKLSKDTVMRLQFAILAAKIYPYYLKKEKYIQDAKEQTIFDVRVLLFDMNKEMDEVDIDE
jgi:hypothetical protein